MCNVKSREVIHTIAIFDLVHLPIPLPDSGLNIGLADATHFGNTALFAAFEGHVYVAALLVDRGANVKARNKDPNSPLFLATSAGCLEMVEVLIVVACPMFHDCMAGEH